MGCSHCMVEATPDGEHMTPETFERALQFASRVGSPFILISGGEPTEHPQLLELLRIADMYKNGGFIVNTSVLSNGLFMEEKDPAWIEEFLSLVDSVQVTNDPRYYPRRLNKVLQHPKIGEVVDTVLTYIALGRGAGQESTRLAPACFNLRSALTQLDLKNAIHTLRSHGKFCTPSVDVDGTVRAGETPLCKRVGTVDSPVTEIENNLRRMRCARCGLIHKLSPMHRGIVGE